MPENIAFNWLSFKSLPERCVVGSTLFHSLMGVSTIPAYFRVVAIPLSSMITHGSFYRLPLEQYKSAKILRATSP